MGIILLPLFLIWPFGAVLFSFKYYSKIWTKNTIWAFVVFYGYLFVLSNDTMDANRILSKFEFFHYNEFNFRQVLDYFYFQNEDGVDIIQPVILYVTSKFTQDFQVLMAVLGFIFGYFYSRNIAYLIDNAGEKIKIYNYLIVWMFVFTVSFWEINMFRFWTAALIYFYAIMPYVYQNIKSKLWLLIFVPLIHFSFLYPLLIFLIYVFTKSRLNVIFYVFLVSFFITSINTETIGELLIRFLPSNFEKKISAYTSAAYAMEVNAAEASISNYLRTIMFAIINIAFVFLYYGYRDEIKRNSNLFRLFTFALLIVAAGNFISLIPSGFRFQFLAALFSLSFLFFYLQYFKVGGMFKVFLQISAPFLLLASLGFIRLGFNTINIMAIVGNPILAFFIESNKALIQFFL